MTISTKFLHCLQNYYVYYISLMPTWTFIGNKYFGQDKISVMFLILLIYIRYPLNVYFGKAIKLNYFSGEWDWLQSYLVKISH